MSEPMEKPYAKGPYKSAGDLHPHIQVHYGETLPICVYFNEGGETKAFATADRIAELLAPQGEQPGLEWRLVPTKPTDEMKYAGGIAFEDSCFGGADHVFDAAGKAFIAMLDASPATGKGVVLDVDALAQEIRRVDGNHDKGAAALAEALMPFLSAALQVKNG